MSDVPFKIFICRSLWRLVHYCVSRLIVKSVAVAVGSRRGFYFCLSGTIKPESVA